MKKFFALLLAVIMVLTMAACGEKKPAATGNEGELPTIEAKLATIYSATHPMGITAQRFADLVSEATDGKFTITVWKPQQQFCFWFLSLSQLPVFTASAWCILVLSWC